MKKENPKAGEKEQIKGKKLSLKAKLIIAAGLALALVAVGFVGLYVSSPIGKLTRPIFKSAPYPAVIVGNGFAVITSSELISNVDAVRKFYETQDYSNLGLRVDFSTAEGKQRLKIKEKDILDKLIEDEIVLELANERGITVTADDAQQSIDQQIGQAGDRKSLELNLKSLYGWSVDEFRDKVVVDQMYMEKLISWYAEGAQQQAGYAKITEARDKLLQDGSNFADVAREFSEGESAENGGEVGWFSRRQLVEEVADAAFEMEQNEISGVITSPLGFHIIQIQETRNVPDQSIPGAPEEKEVKLKQIFVKGKSFLEWLGEEKKRARVFVLMKDYRWDSNEGRVRFADQELEKMEKKLRMQAEGDPSM